jgi:hypothetical protein
MQSALNDLQQLPDGFVFNSQKFGPGLNNNYQKNSKKKQTGIMLLRLYC